MILLGILLVDWIDCSLNLWSWLSTILSPLVVVFYVCLNKLLAFYLSWEMKWDIVDLCVYYFNMFSNVLTLYAEIKYLFYLFCQRSEQKTTVCYVWPCCMSEEACISVSLEKKIVLQLKSQVTKMLFLNLQFCTMLMSSTSTDGCFSWYL